MNRDFDQHRTQMCSALDQRSVRMRVVEYDLVYRYTTPTGAVETADSRTCCALEVGRIVHLPGDEHYIVRNTGERLRRVIP